MRLGKIMNKKQPDTASRDSSVEKRRSAVKKILAGGSVAAGAGITSSLEWKTPVIESVILPVHAQTTSPAISGQIGASDVTGLLDLFMSPAYAGADGPDELVGGCIDITIVGKTVMATVTLNTSVSDTRSGPLVGTSFSIENVNGYQVTGTVDNAISPTTCNGFVGSIEFSAVVNGSCSIVPSSTTTECDSGGGGTCSPE